jgi:hypothetical protein
MEYQPIKNKTEDLLKYRKDYYESNKQRILDMVGKKEFCECCQKKIRKDYILKHNKTKKHILNNDAYNDFKKE